MSLAVVSGLTVYAVASTAAATSLVALTMRMKGQRLEVSRELRASRQRIVLSVEDERRRLERDLHDGAQQRLIALRIQLGLAAELVAHEPQASSRLLTELACEAQGALDELRDLAHGIYPQILLDEGLEAAIADLATDVSRPTRLDLPGIARHAPEIEAAVYFTCMEALQNAVKHAGGDATITIQLRERRGGLYFEVRDTGYGLDTREERIRGGIVNMRDRIGAAGGAIEILSRPGRGTTVMGSIPLGRALRGTSIVNGRERRSGLVGNRRGEHQ
ncbi:MAG TPA: histidine kinase [Solirubrobacteraceae bacterium]